MNKLLIALICAWVWSAALAADQAPVIYSKTVLKVVPTLHPVTTPKDSLKKIDEKQTVTARTIKTYTVDVRPQSFLAQPDFISHQPFADKGGMLVLMDPPQVVSLQSSNLLGNVDVLFVAPDGLITKIAPNISLPALEEPISSDSAVRAFVFLKGEAARADDIEPGDRIENPLFKSHTVILDGSSLPAPPSGQMVK